MRDPLFSSYYDVLQSEKDYGAEAEAVLDLYQSSGREGLRRILDVGCGTGSHALAFAAKGYDVLGVDVDQDMIHRAEEKRGNARDLRLRFTCSDLSRVDDTGFHLAVSLFNVVNYIRSLPDLLLFFQSIRDRLLPGGILIFDAWNGVAAMRDLPGKKEKIISRDRETISCIVEAATDLIGQKAVLRYSIQISGPNGPQRFEYEMEHFLWTPRCLQDLMQMAGLDSLKVLPFMQPEREATASDWKITFVARRP